MNAAYTKPEHFAYYKEASKKYRNNSYPGCDKGMIPVIDVLNTHEQLAVAFCCESHPYARGQGRSEQMYITMAVSGLTGLVYLMNTFGRATELIDERFDKSFLTLEVGNLWYDEKTTWRNWTIEGFPGRKGKKVYMEAILQAARERLPEKYSA